MILGINVKQAENTLKKVEMYRNCEYNDFSKIKVRFSNLSSAYVSDVNKTISSLTMQFSKQFAGMKNLHGKNSLVISKNLETYHNHVIKSVDQLDDLL